MNETALGGVYACGLDFILNQADFICLNLRHGGEDVQIGSTFV